MSNTQPAVDEAVQFRNRLISVLSHGTKGLFANVFWLIEMIESNLADTAMLQQMLPELKSIAQKNLDDYTDTLSWIKTQREDFSPRPVKISIYGLFNQLHDFFKQQPATQARELIFDGDRSTAFFSDEILVRLILKKIIENILNFPLSGKMIIFKTSKSADNKKMIIKVTGNDIERNQIITQEIPGNGAVPVSQTDEEMNIDLQFAKEIASVLNGAIDIAPRINNEITITLTLPLN